MRRIFAALVTIFVVISTGLPALASTGFSVLAPTSIQYNPTSDSFAVTGIALNNAPAFVQLGLALTDNNDVQVDPGDPYRIAVADQCNSDYSFFNSSTGGSVVISGDDTTTVLLAGAPDDVLAAIDSLKIYRQGSSFCSRGAAHGAGQSLLLRRLQVSAIESQPGLFWSPSTKHYYMLATQTTDDGMGQPTDDNGNITDASRYFVRWSTARAEAKSTSITIGGNTHAGYLASIITKDEFGFLNNNVSGGRGTLYPAWVGGSDAGTEGTWKWVDGPEAKQFGGDTLIHDVTITRDPLGNVLQSDGYNTWLKFGPSSYSYPELAFLMRDSAGDLVTDQDTGYLKAVNVNGENSPNYCQHYFQDQRQAWIDFNDPSIGPEVDQTPYGSSVRCDLTAAWYGYLVVWVHPVLVDASGTAYVTNEDSQASPQSFNNIFLRDASGTLQRDSDGNLLVVRPGTADFTTQTGPAPNYDGATFWGPDSGTAPGSYTDKCAHRGVRGICTISQQDTSGTWQSNDYYVHWSNGDRNNVANWDGTSSKPGDGAYNPQPDNSSLNGVTGQNALIINWCTRNASDYSNSSAVTETLYGNSDYHCTPGWNDLAAGDWGGASSTYPNQFQNDTPNQIGTTDYVVEFCGYSDEASCAGDSANFATVAFTLPSQGCPQTSTPALSVSYAGAHLDSTDLTSATMATETFDNISTGWIADQMTEVGYLSGTTYVAPAGAVGGSGGTGNYPTTVDSYLTLPTTECYLGFWWSAGNSNNNVDLLDANNNVLASFTAGDLVTALGACPNDYCGNPNDGFQNPNELYAFVHLRLPSGFQKVHFYGAGFELDNITVSVSVPGRTSNETHLGATTELALDAPQVILVDPRAASVGFPGVKISGDPNATLCFRQVADSEGTPMLGNPSATFGDDQNDPITTQTINDDFVASGPLSDVEAASSHMISSALNNHKLGHSGSIYFKVFAVAGASPSATTCETGSSKVVEIRPIGIDVVSNLEAVFGRN